MSLLGKSGLDTTSWAKSLWSSSRIALTCVIGIILAWLVLRVVAPSADGNIVTALYNTTSSNTSLLIIYEIATMIDLISALLIFWHYFIRKDRNECTLS